MNPVKAIPLFAATFIIFVFAGCVKEPASSSQSPTPADSTVVKKDSLTAPTKPLDTCGNQTSKGRIIGFDPFQCFLNYDSLRFENYAPGKGLGPGYLVEIDNGNLKDTVISYRIYVKDFIFHAAFKDMQSGVKYFFTKEFQDSALIKFNFRYADTLTKLRPIAMNGGEADYLEWRRFAERKPEVILSCVSRQ